MARQAKGSRSRAQGAEKENGAYEYGLRVAEVPITIHYGEGAKRPAVKQGRIVLNGILRLVGHIPRPHGITQSAV